MTKKETPSDSQVPFTDLDLGNLNKGRSDSGDETSVMRLREGIKNKLHIFIHIV